MRERRPPGWSRSSLIGPEACELMLTEVPEMRFTAPAASASRAWSERFPGSRSWARAGRMSSSFGLDVSGTRGARATGDGRNDAGSDAFLRSVFPFLRWKAREVLGLRSVTLAHPGAVSVIQRASGHLALNVHFHSLVSDGVFIRDEPDGPLTFHELLPPTEAHSSGKSPLHRSHALILPMRPASRCHSWAK